MINEKAILEAFVGLNDRMKVLMHLIKPWKDDLFEVDNYKKISALIAKVKEGEMKAVEEIEEQVRLGREGFTAFELRAAMNDLSEYCNYWTINRMHEPRTSLWVAMKKMMEEITKVYEVL